MLFSGQFNVKDKHVAITGASQGLGAEMGRQMVQRGALSVTVIARTEHKLKAVVEQMELVRVDIKQVLHYVVADVSNYEACASAVEKLPHSPDIVFLFAGSSIPKLFLDLTPKELQQGIDVNYNTSLMFSHAVMKEMAKHTPKHTRHMVFCSSVLAVFPFIGYGQYAPGKAAIRALSEVLRHEAIPYNIKVECIYPGNFASEGYAEEEKTKPSITKDIEGPSAAISVEQCANVVLWWLGRGYESVYTDMIGWVLSSGMLGFGPRVFGLLQVFLALLLAIVGPIYMWITHRDIRSYFNKKKSE